MTNRELLQDGILIREGRRELAMRLKLRWDQEDAEKSWEPFEGDLEEVGEGLVHLKMRRDPFLLELRLHEEEGFLLFETSIHVAVDAPDPILLRDIRWETERIGDWPEDDELRWWWMSHDVWGQPDLLRLDDEINPRAIPHWRCGVLEPEGGRGMVWSTRLPANWRQALRMENRQLVIETVVDAHLDPGAHWRNDMAGLALDRLVFESLRGPRQFQVSRRRPWEVNALGMWNSWDYYHLNIDRDAVMENVEAIRGHDFLRDFVRYIIIDDGWQTLTGVWEANESFPDGMDGMAREIRDAGFLPGIWSAAFFAEAGCPIFDQHPEYCVQYNGEPLSPFKNRGNGPPWGNRHYLDPTRPEVVDHVYRLYRKLYDWGYRYFKTDFLANAMLVGEPPNIPPRLNEGPLRFHDPEMGLLRAHRRCMQAIRAAIGEKSFWLGCGSVWATGAGLMDASRMSGDISVTYPSLLKCGSSVLWNGHTHGRVWLSDPDFLVVRGPDTMHPEYHDSEPPNCGKPPKKPQFSLSEARMWASLVILSGGMAVLSDRIAALNEDGLEILRIVAREAGGLAGRAIDMESPRPRIVLKQERDRVLLGLFNWEDTDAPALDLKWAKRLPALDWLEIWSGEKLTTRKLTDRQIPGHSCLLLKA
ncbi:MAG: glycoside hydrolase family 36 protein [Candidatus Sumerlaeia bacterium]